MLTKIGYCALVLVGYGIKPLYLVVKLVLAANILGNNKPTEQQPHGTSNKRNYIMRNNKNNIIAVL